MSASFHSYRAIFFKLLDLSFFEAFRGRELEWARENSQKAGRRSGEAGIQAKKEKEMRNKK